MPRRKNAYLSDGSDSEASASGSVDEYDSQEDEDSRAERRLFENKGNKRRKTAGRGGKESAWEGIFGEEEEQGRGGRGVGSKGRGGASATRSDWTRAPAFVSSGPKETEVQEEEEVRDAAAEAPSGSDESSGESASEEDETRPPSPRVREEEEDEPPRRGMGLGSMNGFASAGSMPLDTTSNGEGATTQASGGRGGIGSSSRGRGGIGSSSRQAPPPPSSSGANTPRGGIGSSSAPVNPIEESAPPPGIPTAFGRPPPSLSSGSGASRTQRSFLPKAAPTPTAASTIDLTPAERAHFRNIEGSFGAKFLKNFGWQAGKGLGAQEDGRAVPVEVGKVFRGQGIQKGMRTEDSKREARRKGEEISDDEEDQPKRRGHKVRAKLPKEPKEEEQGWKKQKKVKVKVEHKSYEQLLAEAGDAAAGAGIGLVLDARGGELKEVQSLSALSLSTWTPTSDATRLPELRHNLRLIVDVAKGDVEGLAREGKSVNERRRWALREEQISRQKVEQTERRISRLKQIQTLVGTITTIAAEQAATPSPSLLPLTESFNTLIKDFKDEYRNYALDDVIVGAISQVLRRAFADWQPFDVSSDVLLSALKPWHAAYNLPKSEDDEALAMTINGDESHRRAAKQENGERVMTAWESLIWTLWLPKVRSAINNDWDPSRPHAAVHLLESWESILPPFIRDNVLDQLILPKVKAAVEQWDPRKHKSDKNPKSLASIVFPWLPLLGERVEEVLEGAKRRIRSILRSWVVKDGVPEELARWRKDVYSSSEWDKLIIQYVLPKLGVCLRDDFTINPRKQDMVPLEDWVMPWHKLLRASMFSHLLEAEFFPKWLDILYIWLVQPAYKPDEVANWFVWWKSRFPDAVLEMRGVSHGFNSGLELMNEAMRLGSEAPTKLKKPVFEPLPPSKSSKSSKSSTTSRRPIEVTSAGAAPEITFRNIAEDYATQNDLIILPVGRSHSQTGKPLFKICKNVDGRGGVTIYVGENAVFAQMEDGAFRAMSLEDMVKKASG
ncbi:hypothetical protein CI109_105533 [Kwoniella shandongensis]|uniref:Uncharacterized protein n=1 Tax=Kwoniella shandongensis TaxID=1734106 RepID=A0A5M6C3L5_9TREE|nr:uncharacterized protein CI109_002254 [Kwoniella shandongensis]KAA5529361.1 hypothetical protein CI109_002254 [Kwoniella shandongensis]